MENIMAGSHTIDCQKTIEHILIAEAKPHGTALETFRLQSLMDAVCQRKNWCAWEMQKKVVLS